MNAEQKTILKSFIPPFVFVVVLWAIKFAEVFFNISFSDDGVLPRHADGLIGILTAPLIHADFEHLTSNSIPFLILGAGLIYFYKEIALKVFVLIYLLSGFWLWLGGRENYHIGASGVVYGMVTFLFFSGILRKHIGLMALSMLVVFLYGGLVWGILPIYKVISWESHLFGSLAGILCAFVYRKQGPQRKVYHWEDDTDDGSTFEELLLKSEQTNEPAPDTAPAETDEQKINIHYIYKTEHANKANEKM